MVLQVNYTQIHWSDLQLRYKSDWVFCVIAESNLFCSLYTNIDVLPNKGLQCYIDPKFVLGSIDSVLP